MPKNFYISIILLIHIIHNVFQDKLTYYLHTPLKSPILFSLDYNIAGTKLIMQWLHFYHYFSGSSLASRTIASGMSEDTFQLCTFRIPLLYCCPTTQITNSGSRQCIYCPQYTWKWFPGLAVTFLGSRWDWLSCGFPSPPSVPFCAKAAALLSLPSPRPQWPLFLMFGQQQCHARLISCLHDSVNLIHTPLGSLSMSGTVQDSFLAKHPILSLDPFSSWNTHKCWFIAQFCFKAKKNP